MHYQWGRKDPFTPATNTGYVNANNTKEVQIYKADGSTITKGDRGIGTTDEHEFKVEARTTTTQTTINHLIQNPSTHYYKGDGTNTVPIASTTDLTKEWWNPTIKTIYDPCPNGYRIPKSGTYGNSNNSPEWIISDPYSGLTAGYTWNNNDISFFPASGSRMEQSGRFYNIGVSGYYQMSAPQSATFNCYLRITAGHVSPHNSFHRSVGMPTRCIKE